jgi:formylglycine-generating enzyme
MSPRDTNQAPFVKIPPDGSGLPFLVEHEKTGMLMVLVPSGKFLFGDRGKMQGKSKPFEVDVPAYYIALHPVTNRQYERFVKEGKYPPPEIADLGNAVWQDRRYPEEKVDHPVVCVTWHDAAAYCDWAGLRLPSDLEWEKAARGTDGRTYPWGDKWDPDKCRNYDNKGWKLTAQVWQYPTGASPYGAYQMSGNVSEWCEDRYESYPHVRYRRGDFSAPKNSKTRVTRGLNWHHLGPDAFTTSERYAGTPGLRCDYDGFRCAIGAGAIEDRDGSLKGFTSVTDKWLEASDKAELADFEEGTFLRRMETEDPPQAVTLVAALALSGKATAVARQRIAESEHWLIRLAGLVTGLVRTELNTNRDGNFWVREMGR